MPTPFHRFSGNTGRVEGSSQCNVLIKTGEVERYFRLNYLLNNDYYFHLKPSDNSRNAMVETGINNNNNNGLTR